MMYYLVGNKAFWYVNSLFLQVQQTKGVYILIVSVNGFRLIYLAEGFVVADMIICGFVFRKALQQPECTKSHQA
jgi:hypothetical protein